MSKHTFICSKLQHSTFRTANTAFVTLAEKEAMFAAALRLLMTLDICKSLFLHLTTVTFTHVRVKVLASLYCTVQKGLSIFHCHCQPLLNQLSTRYSPLLGITMNHAEDIWMQILKFTAENSKCLCDMCWVLISSFWTFLVDHAKPLVYIHSLELGHHTFCPFAIFKANKS